MTSARGSTVTRKPFRPYANSIFFTATPLLSACDSDSDATSGDRWRSGRSAVDPDAAQFAGVLRHKLGLPARPKPRDAPPRGPHPPQPPRSVPGVPHVLHGAPPLAPHPS